MIKINKIGMIFLFGLIVVSLGISFVSAEEASVCCEKTKTGFFCQNAPISQCDTGNNPFTQKPFGQVPTSCESTSYCKKGYCFDSTEGTCLDNTPQNVCNEEGGVWSAEKPAQCELGCCTLGDQAAFVTLTRCKKLASFAGLKTNFDKGITDEETCVMSVAGQEKGACVFDFEFQRTCKFTTRTECNSGLGGDNVTGATGQFYPGKLCSAEELGTNCGPTKKTVCVPGKDEVYFVDSCGNPANIYDSSKIDDKEYWGNVKTKLESCGVAGSNGNSKSCGNCNYLLGSFCRASSSANANPIYGDSICADLNCPNTQNGKSYKHGESWCVYDDKGGKDNSNNAVGSRFYKHICVNGEEVLEQCADFRQEECIESGIKISAGTFSQAACRVNRWQDCTAQTEKIDCENTDRRDCVWKADYQIGNSTDGACIPKNSPGLKFWEGEESQSICAQANAQCIVTFEKGLFGGEECKDNCQCLSGEWEKQRAEVCSSLGDCGPKINWIGSEGYKKGYNISIS